MTRSTDNLVRNAAGLARRHGLELQRTLASDEGELRQLVVVSGSAQPGELCVRVTGERALDRTRREVDALRATRSEHVLRLIDVLPAPERRGRPGTPALLLEHAPGGDLVTFLERRHSIRAGEASTILLGMARGLEALHRGEWAHGSLTAQCVVFRRDGCPAITALADATPLTVRSLYDDRSAYLRVAGQVTEAVGDEGNGMLGAVHDALGLSGWDGVARVLLDIAQPEAVLMPFRVEESHPEPEALEGSRLAQLLDENPLAAVKDSVRAWVSSRKKLIAVALSPVALAAVVLAVLPGGGDATRAVPNKPPIASPARTAAPERSTAQDAADDSEDPVRAAEGLLSERHGCLAAKRPAYRCLEGIEQAGSPLLMSDSDSLGTAGAAAASDPRGVTLSLEERWGDAALISMTPSTDEAGSQEETGKSEPASLLVIRSEAGWRLREIYRD